MNIENGNSFENKGQLSSISTFSNTIYPNSWKWLPMLEGLQVQYHGISESIVTIVHYNLEHSSILYNTSFLSDAHIPILKYPSGFPFAVFLKPVFLETIQLYTPAQKD